MKDSKDEVYSAMGGNSVSPMKSQSNRKGRSLLPKTLDDMSVYDLKDATHQSNSQSEQLHWAIRIRKRLLINGSHRWNAWLRDFTGMLERKF